MFGHWLDTLKDFVDFSRISHASHFSYNSESYNAKWSQRKGCIEGLVKPIHHLES